MNSLQIKKVEKIYPFWKKFGESLSETKERFLVFYPHLKNKIIRYEGRLDPLAEGIILFLEDVHDEKINNFVRSLSKRYRVRAFFGFSSESGDVLSSPIENNLKTFFPPKKELLFFLKKSESCFFLSLPRFSSPYIKRILKKKDKYFSPEKKEMCFSGIQLRSYSFIEKERLIAEIKRNIFSASPKFSREKFFFEWENLFSSSHLNFFLVVEIELTLSSGSYVRSFLTYLSSHFSSPITSLSIRRENFGPWTMGSFSN